jgi:acyl-coenzyme A synthetase/AMP-(fatty) acid ligase
LVAGGTTVRYRELVALVSNTVHALHRAGVGPGEVTGVTFHQPVLATVVLLALARLGAVSACTAPRMPPAEREAILRRFGARHEVCDGSAPAVEGVKRHVVRGIAARGSESRLDAAPFAPDSGSPLRLALTSGTTGTPKAVLQTHGSFVDRMERMQCGDMRGARVLPPPLNVTAALNMAMQALCEGGTVVFSLDDTPSGFLDTLRRERVTHVGLPPANVAVLLRELPGTGAPAFPHVTHLRLMGATPSPALLAAARARFSPDIYLPYGIAEIGVVAMATPDILERMPGASGRIAPGAAVEILDAEGRACPPGMPGEVRLALEGMPRGYHGPDAQDRTRFRDGWFYPGDRGHVTEDGVLFIEGRADGLLNVGGRKAAPEYLERVLESYPGVTQAAVFAMAREDGATTLAAAVVGSGLDWAALHRFTLARLSTLAPERYFAAQTLPRGELGKLARGALAATYAGAAPELDSPLFEVPP